MNAHRVAVTDWDSHPTRKAESEAWKARHVQPDEINSPEKWEGGKKKDRKN